MTTVDVLRRWERMPASGISQASGIPGGDSSRIQCPSGSSGTVIVGKGRSNPRKHRSVRGCQPRFRSESPPIRRLSSTVREWRDRSASTKRAS